MDRLNLTVEALEEKSLINTKTIQRIRNDERYQPKLATAVALCIGMQLSPILSRDMISKAGISFRISEEHIIYQMLLNSYYQNSIYECNEILRTNNFKPLSTEE
jgi:DNA-binding XRE family transcriptional regulator